jgi:uncharacterized protein
LRILQRINHQQAATTGMPSFAVGNLACEKGEKNFGSLTVVEDPLEEVKVPLGLVNGSHDGPTVCIIAGTHACEYVGIDTAVMAYHSISPRTLNGKLVILPVINPVAFKTITPYVNPMDGLNLSFMFTGNREGTTTERMAQVILESAVLKSDYTLDLHGGDLNEIMLSSVIAGVTGSDEVDRKVMELARAFGTEYIIKHTPDEGPSTAAKYSYQTTIESQGAARGIPGIVGEIGSDGRTSPEEVAFYFSRVQNVLKYLKMMPGTPEVPPLQTIIGGSVRLRASRGGVFWPHVKVGEKLSKGALIGEVADLKGDIIEKVLAPQDSLVSLIFTKHIVVPGQILVSLATRIEKLPPFAILAH